MIRKVKFRKVESELNIFNIFANCSKFGLQYSYKAMFLQKKSLFLAASCFDERTRCPLHRVFFSISYLKLIYKSRHSNIVNYNILIKID